VGTPAVVVVNVFAHHQPEVALPEDEHPVEAFSTGALHPTLGVGFCPRRPRRGLHRHDALGPEDLVEHVGELGITVTNQDLWSWAQIACVSRRSCSELAGESPVTVMIKQPCSWWVMEGETRLLKPHDKVALGGEQARGPYDEEAYVSAVSVPVKAGRSGSRAPRRWAKAMEGAEILEVQHPRTRRRRGIGMITQPITERERSVSAPGDTAVGCQSTVLVKVKPISGDPVKWWNAERKSEEAIW
jgi:hypothetical protein